MDWAIKREEIELAIIFLNIEKNLCSSRKNFQKYLLIVSVTINSGMWSKCTKSDFLFVNVVHKHYLTM